MMLATMMELQEQHPERADRIAREYRDRLGRELGDIIVDTVVASYQEFDGVSRRC